MRLVRIEREGQLQATADASRSGPLCNELSVNGCGMLFEKLAWMSKTVVCILFYIRTHNNRS